MSRRELIAGLALALFLRLGFTVHAYHKEIRSGAAGTYTYEPIARALLASGVYSLPPGGVPTAGREPGYILFIALIYKTFTAHRLCVFLAQALMSAVTAGLLYGLAARLFSAAAARFAFWACVFYPYFIYYTAYFFRESLLAFLLALILYVLARWKNSAAAFGAGLLAGWLCLVNGAWAPACFWMAAAPHAIGTRDMKLRRSAAFILPLLLMVGAWTWRNWVVFREVIPFSAYVGGEIYISMTIPYEVLGTEEQSRLLNADERFAAISKIDGEIEQNKAYMAAAKDYFLAHPLQFLARQAEHAAKLWRVLPHDRAYTHAYAAVALAALGSDGWLFPLALLGLWVKRRDPWVRWTFLPTILLVTAAFSISQSPIRYRVPLMIIVLMLAGVGFDELLRRRRALT
ncbi:MAG: glycosyltransferase family 39 protein [Elusimicrobia bacterium]|nr:glycosyltransferase family 39 protein [Elusimicrobiota bacterium]